MTYALYTNRLYCGVAFTFLRNPRIKRTGKNGTVSMFDFVELNYSGISSCTSIESSVIVKCAHYNFSKKSCTKTLWTRAQYSFQDCIKIYFSAPLSVEEFNSDDCLQEIKMFVNYATLFCHGCSYTNYVITFILHYNMMCCTPLMVEISRINEL